MEQRPVGKLNEPVFAEFCCFYNGDLTFCEDNRDLNRVFGVDGEISLVGRSLYDFVLESEVLRLKTELCAQAEDGNEFEFLVITVDGRWILGKGVLNAEGEVPLMQGVFVAIKRFKKVFYSQKRKLDEYEGKLVESNERASKDSLTMISNAKTSRALCEEYISSNERGFALMVIDVDCFKRINDIYGHMVGDRALIAIADIIKNLFRNNDIVGRIGGDEFLVLMKGVEDRAIVETRSSQIVSAFGKVKCCEMAENELSCSVGVAFVKHGGKAYDEVFRVADKAMYSAKENGGNCFEIIDF